MSTSSSQSLIQHNDESFNLCKFRRFKFQAKDPPTARLGWVLILKIFGSEPELPVPVGPRFRLVHVLGTFVWSVSATGPFGFGTLIPVSDNGEKIVLRENT